MHNHIAEKLLNICNDLQYLAVAQWVTILITLYKKVNNALLDKGKEEECKKVAENKSPPFAPVEDNKINHLLQSCYPTPLLRSCQPLLRSCHIPRPLFRSCHLPRPLLRSCHLPLLLDFLAIPLTMVDLNLQKT